MNLMQMSPIDDESVYTQPPRHMNQAPLPPAPKRSRSQSRSQLEKMEFVIDALKKSPFRRSEATVDVEKGLPNSACGRLEMLNEVLAEIDPTSSENMLLAPEKGVDKMIALLKVLGLAAPKDSGFRERLLNAEARLVLELLHWILRDMSIHKKRVYEVRLALPITALAEHSKPLSFANYQKVEAKLSAIQHHEDRNQMEQSKTMATPAALHMAKNQKSTPPPTRIAARGRDVKARKELQSQPKSKQRLFEEIVEIGLPEAWDVDKLLIMSRLDSNETKARPWLSVAQRWTKAMSRGANDKKGEKKLTPPKDCLHPTEAGAFDPRIIWRSHALNSPETDYTSSPLSGAEIAGFCFPDGIKLREVSQSAVCFKDNLCVSVFQVAIPLEDVNKEGNAKKRYLYGICLLDTRRIQIGEYDKTSSIIELPRCFCLLTYWPFVELHIRVLRSAVLFGKKLCVEQTDTMYSAESRMREAVDRILIEYKKHGVPEPGSELRCVVPSDKKRGQKQISKHGVHATELVYERPEAGRSDSLLEESLKLHLARQANPSLMVPPDCEWTRAEYASLDSTADWSVPLFLAALPSSQIMRCLAAVLSELQIVILSEQQGLGAACCLGLAALLRPLLWVSPLVPVLPTQLHAILEAPTPYIVATPRTPAWLECITHRLPHPGLVILDVDAGALCFHPQDADLVELPNPQALLEVLAPALQIIQTDFSKKTENSNNQIFSPPVVTPSMRKAGRVVQRLVAKHIARLCSIAISLDSEIHGSRITLNGKSNRTRESLEFAALLRQELLDDDNEQPMNKSGATNAKALRDSVDRSFVATGDIPVSNSIVDPNYLHPLRRTFFERLTESQSFQVFRDTFPSFQGANAKEVRTMLGVSTQLSHKNKKQQQRRRSI